MNALFRRYFLKEEGFTTLSEKIMVVVDKLNHHPRTTRGYKTPYELFTRQSEVLVAA